MKTIFKIHPLYYIVAFIMLINGLFRDFVYITIIILVHEAGHVIGALYYKWKIDKIIILPFGGITLFNELLNRKIKEEYIILILGPLFQIIFYLILLLLNIENNLYKNYNYFILLLNLLPILPLDGSKLLNIIFNKFFSFKQSHLLSIYISFITILLIIISCFFYSNLVIFIFVIFLFTKVIDEIKKHNYILNKFFYERYYYNLNFKKNKIIKGLNINKMFRDYKHVFYCNKYYTEKEILKRKFHD